MDIPAQLVVAGAGFVVMIGLGRLGGMSWGTSVLATTTIYAIAGIVSATAVVCIQY